MADKPQTQTFTELKDFAKFHLSSTAETGESNTKMFKIPKFNFGKPSTSTVVVTSAVADNFSFSRPTSTDDPLPELKLLDINSKPRIDLTSALNQTSSLRSDRSSATKSFSASSCIVFIERRRPNVDTKSKISGHLKKGSHFGRILCSNYKCQNDFILPKRKTLKNKILKSFDFSTASPDDLKIQFFQS